MSMNARSYDMESREITKRKLYDIAEEMEKITDCKFDLEYVDGYEPIINDPGIVDLVISACRKNMGEDSVKIGEYDEGSDDAYSGDYDEDRYDNDESYRDGVDDMLDELGE